MDQQLGTSGSGLSALREVSGEGHRYYETIHEKFLKNTDATYKEKIGLVVSQQIGDLIHLLLNNGIELSAIRAAISILNPATSQEDSTALDGSRQESEPVGGRPTQAPDAMPSLGAVRQAEDVEGFQPVRTRKGAHCKQEPSDTDGNPQVPRQAATQTKVRLLLSNLGPTITKSAIEAYFSKYGPVGYVRVYNNIIRKTGDPFVKGFVEFASERAAESALAARNVLGNRIIEVERPGKRQMKAFHVHLKGIPIYHDGEEIVKAIYKRYRIQILNLKQDPPTHGSAEASVRTEAEAKLLLQLGCIEVDDVRVEVDPAWEAKK